MLSGSSTDMMNSVDMTPTAADDKLLAVTYNPRASPCTSSNVSAHEQRSGGLSPLSYLSNNSQQSFQDGLDSKLPSNMAPTDVQPSYAADSHVTQGAYRTAYVPQEGAMFARQRGDRTLKPVEGVTVPSSYNGPYKDDERESGRQSTEPRVTKYKDGRRYVPVPNLDAYEIETVL